MDLVWLYGLADHRSHLQLGEPACAAGAIRAGLERAIAAPAAPGGAAGGQSGFVAAGGADPVADRANSAGDDFRREVRRASLPEWGQARGTFHPRLTPALLN